MSTLLTTTKSLYLFLLFFCNFFLTVEYTISENNKEKNNQDRKNKIFWVIFGVFNGVVVLTYFVIYLYFKIVGISFNKNEEENKDTKEGYDKLSNDDQKQ